MKRYDSYKPTGLKWFSEIPIGWEWRFLSQVAHEQNIKKPAGEMYPVMTLSYGEIKRKANIDAGLVPSNYDNYQMLYRGNIVLRLIDLQNDHTSLRTGLVKETGIITSAYTCIAPIENAAYVRYLLHSYDTRKVFYGYGGGVRQSIGYKDIRHLQVPVPPREEQDQIVRYLDWQVSKINRLIAAKRKQISVLQEQHKHCISDAVLHGIVEDAVHKDSGVEWIGAIPEHWSAIRCKYVFTERDERSVAGEEEHLSMSQKYGLVPDSKLDERRMLSESYAGGKICYKDDLVLNRLKAHLGVFALSPQKCVISPDYTVLVPNTERILPAYGEAVLKSDLCRRELRIRVRGIIEGFWRLYTDDFNTIVIPLPPLKEQEQIMEYLSTLNGKFTALKQNLEREISTLQDLRTRLISDVVTGQVDVRDIEVPEYESFEDVSSDDDESEGTEEQEEE